MRVNVEFPDADALRSGGDVTVADLPRFALAERTREVRSVDDLEASVRRAVDSIDAFETLSRGAEVGITAGSRRIADMPTVLATAVDELSSRGYEPFVLPAMGNHGGATAEGQVETLAALGITPNRWAVRSGRRWRSRPSARTTSGGPFTPLGTRSKPTRYSWRTGSNPTPTSADRSRAACRRWWSSGWGKHRGAESLHNAAIATDFATVIRENGRPPRDDADRRRHCARRERGPPCGTRRGGERERDPHP